MVATISTYKYHFKVEGKIVRIGITGDLERRERQLQQHRGWAKGHIVRVGKITSRDAAIAWAMEQEAKGKPVRL